MSKTHFDTKSVEIVTDDDGDRYIGQDDVKRIFNDSNLHRQSIIDGNRDGVKYTTMDAEYGVLYTWYDAEYIERLCADRNKEQREMIGDLFQFINDLATVDPKEFAHKYASLEALTSLRELSQPVYAIMHEHEDWIVPEFPHDENSKACITIQQYLDALYEGDTVREYASARHVLSRDEDHALLGGSSIKFVSVNSLEYTNKTAVNRRDLSGLLSKIESGEIRSTSDQYGTYVRAADAVREMIALD